MLFVQWRPAVVVSAMIDNWIAPRLVRADFPCLVTTSLSSMRRSRNEASCARYWPHFDSSCSFTFPWLASIVWSCFYCQLLYIVNKVCPPPFEYPVAGAAHRSSVTRHWRKMPRFRLVNRFISFEREASWRGFVIEISLTRILSRMKDHCRTFVSSRKFRLHELWQTYALEKILENLG